MRYDDDDDYYRHEDRAMREYDRWLTSPPEQPECPECDEKAQRISDLEDIIEWVGKNIGRIFVLPRQGDTERVALMPWSGPGVCEGKTYVEALEKLKEATE